MRGRGVWGGLLTHTSPIQHAAKQAAASATQTIAAAQHAASSNKNPAAQQQLVQSCKVRAGGLIPVSPEPPVPIPSPISSARVLCSAAVGRQDRGVLMQFPQEPIFWSLVLD